ncbi:MAG: hypothetical protein WDZ35_10640 [Crocinitomicaceae bacterium]
MQVPEHKIPKWLQNLQENSWELELLISGGAIFSLFQLSDYFLDFIFSLKMTSRLPGTGLFIMLGMLGLKLLTVGFITHLLLRAFWLALVCINYVYPQGITVKKWKSAFPFKEKNKAEDNLHTELIKVDKTAGLVMFFSILSILIIGGALFYIIVTITIPAAFIGFSGTYFSIVMLLFLFYFLDLLLFGVFRKIPGLSIAVFPFFWLMDTLTLRFLYRKSLAMFATNINRWKASVGFFIIFFAALSLSYGSIYRAMHWPNIFDSRENRWNMASQENWMSHYFYMDVVEKDGIKLSSPAIQSQIIQENFLKLHVPYSKGYDSYLEPSSKEHLSDLFSVQINDSLYNNVEWFSYWAKENDQIAMMAIIDIKHLSRGKHTLWFTNKKDPEMKTKIPFWKDVE